jgi:hypothetical protein
MELVIRDSEGKICAWLVGMSSEEIEDYLRKHPGSYRSTAEWCEEKGMTL